MKKNKLLIAIGAAVLIGLVSLLAYKSQNHSASDGVIRIGVILPLSGDWGQFGQRMLNGILLWEAEHPEAHIKLYIEDGQGNASKSAIAFSKLVNVDKITACISGVSPVILAIAPLADKAKVFTVNAGATNPDIKKASDYVFTIIPDAEIEARFIATFVYKQLGFKECYVLWKNDDSGLGMLNCFAEEFTLHGGEILGNDAILSLDSIRNSLEKIKEKGAKVVFVPTNGEMVAKIIKQAYMMGMKDIQWVGYAATESPELLRDLAGLEDVRLMFSSYAFNAIDAFSEKSTNFIKRYQKKYNETPAYYSATCYDAIDIIYKAMESEKCDIKSAVQNFEKYAGVSGNFDIAGNYVSSGMTIKYMGSGEIRTLAK